MKKQQQIRNVALAAVAGLVAVVVLVMGITRKPEPAETTEAVLPTEAQATEPVTTDPAQTLWDAYFATMETEAPILEEYEALKAEIPDLIGWIRIADTGIDYPVVQGENDFYITHDCYGNEDVYGAIFLEQVNDAQKPDNNLMIYGHNRKDPQMFGELMEYKSEEYYKAHPYIEFDTLYAKGKYEIISVFLSKVYYTTDTNFKYYQFFGSDDPEEFQNFVDNVKSMSLYPIDASAEFGDELITLSTCEYTVEGGRMGIVAKKISDVEE